ncbi:MAG: 3-keto-5-aminohexanoate cleavage protein [Sphingobium sp. 66-54]|nr:MAG: 3-keto-5-aminohexanoate cleavage protein [Sphingobium sp. 66-54]
MRNAIASVSLSGTLESKIRAAAAAGFDEIEIFDTDFLASPLSPREVKALLDDLGLGCTLYQPFRDLEGLPEPYRQRAFDRARQKFDVMAQLRCDRILLCSNCSPHAVNDRPRMVADLQDLGEVAKDYGILVGYEALAWAPIINDHRDAWDLVRAVDHPNVGILLDSFHSLSRKVPSESIREIDPNKIVYVQLADAPILDMDYLYWSRHFRNLPGQGSFDVTSYVTELMRIGYDGVLSLEIFNDRFRSNSATMVARDGVRSLNALRDAAARRLDLVVDMPAPAEIMGLEFVEFAVAPEDRSAMCEMLNHIGFRASGRHRVKDVEHWRGGKANIVLNFEDTGFARAYRNTHGSSLCAIGLTVADSQAAVARAHALGLAQEASDIPAMPAIRGVGGSLVYIVDDKDMAAIWADEFEAMAGSPAAEAPDILGIDHLAVVVHNDEFLSWQLYWRAMFDVQPQGAQDVIDPNGLVLSQAIENASGTFRLTMNSTDARGALSARFLTHSFGAGFQHIALRTDDIFALARETRARGLQCLPIPANYHDDVAARFGIAAEESGAMRSLDILVDEDGAGNRYRQFYSRAFHKSFFFEFVQRDGYQGYGAPNAPIRLNAQAQFRSDDLP